MASGIEKRTLLCWMREPDERAPIRATDTNAESFTATGAGSTTTTVCTALTGATNDIYVGLILKCVAGTAENVGCDVEVLSFNAGTDTLTHTAFPGSTASGDQFVSYLPPDPIFAVSTSDTNVIDATRDEATDYYAGDYGVVRASTVYNSGFSAQISAFVSASGTAASSGFTGGAHPVGSLVYMRRFPKLWGPPTLAWKREDLEHVTQRANFDNDQSIAGSKECTAEVTLPLKASGTSAGDGVAAIPPPELKLPLESIFTAKINTGEAVGVGSSTTVVQVTDGTLAEFNVGGFCMDSAGRAAVVTATAADGGNPDDITVNPPLQRAPISGEILYGGYSYEPKVTGHNTMTLDSWIGGVTNVKMYGCLPSSLKLTFPGRNKVPLIQIGYKGNYWLETAYALPSALTPVFDTVRPIDDKDSLVTLVATGTTTATRLILKDASVDYGIMLATEDGFTLPDAMYGSRIIGFKPRVTVTAYLDTASPNNIFAELQRYMGGQSFSLMIQHGRDVGKTVAWYAHKCAWLSPTHGVSDGIRTVTFVAEVVASELTNMAMCTLGFI